MNSVSEFWRIVTMKGSSYEYVIEDIQLQDRNGALSSLIYYRAIGSRALNYNTASELNSSDAFSRFSHIQAQAIVTLSTLEKMITFERDVLITNYQDYVKKCAEIFRSQRKK